MSDTQSFDVIAEDILREYGLDNINLESSDESTETPSSSSLVSSLLPPSLEDIIEDGNAPHEEPTEEPTEEDFIAEDNSSSISTNSMETEEETLITEENTTVETATAPTEPIIPPIEELLDLLPVNSQAFQLKEHTSRFSGAEWFKAIQSKSVVLAGLGGIGSYSLFCLSRVSPKHIYLYDDDIVELANLSGQLYSSEMVGKKKVDAMSELANKFSMYLNVSAIPKKFTRDTASGDIMICGFDNMEARKDFFNAWLNHISTHPSPQDCLFIDGRLSLDEFQVFCFKGDDSYNIKRYADEYLFFDYEAESNECSRKQTTYCSNMIGSVIVNLFVNFVTNTLNPLIERDLPFKTYYDSKLMYFKTEL